MQVDIIGGGLSGLATALSIKRHDASVDVIVHEKHGCIGNNFDGRKCGEAHCIESFSLKWKPPAETIASPVYHGKNYAGKKVYMYDRQPGTAWILNRPRYIAYLGEMAKERGVEFRLNARITDVSRLSGEIIVDASGCPSIVKKSLGFPHRYIGYGYQQTMQQCSAFEENTIKIYYENHGGYYWIFPRDPEKREANIGVGFCDINHDQLPVLLEEFKKKQDITGKIDFTTGGLIPGGLQYPLRYKNIIFVGDAGVGTLLLNGQGIYRALLSGDIAGRYIVHQDLKGYAHQIMRDFIKMDIVGKLFFHGKRVLRSINEDLVLSSWEWYQLLNDKVTFFKSEYDTIYSLDKDE